MQLFVLLAARSRCVYFNTNPHSWSGRKCSCLSYAFAHVALRHLNTHPHSWSSPPPYQLGDMLPSVLVTARLS